MLHLKAIAITILCSIIWLRILFSGVLTFDWIWILSSPYTVTIIEEEMFVSKMRSYALIETSTLWGANDNNV